MLKSSLCGKPGMVEYHTEKRHLADIWVLGWVPQKAGPEIRYMNFLRMMSQVTTNVMA